ncbi:surfeit locus protein 2 [Hippoglossus hippoglossus]|uniref:surfeit locus protein 2 n=1 Tax=Hippoglossus hippoglossus TaxID=8267 RepID=UPI00148E0C67|nr:surfeit locus protein 2 [Hippoglossus hippoglossus]XP_034997548.1 surfeit locus protein 2 [Hippoglossus stenolepis]
MEELPADLGAFLLNHPFLQLTDSKKIKCTLNGHEFPCNLTELQKFTQGKKYEKLSATAEFNYSQHEPHVVPSIKQTNQLFCKLTLRHLNRQPHHVLRHVNGKRFKKALAKYEECVKQGIDFVPARLKQKKPRDNVGEDVGRGRASKQGRGTLDPSSSDEDHSDSEDSMSDLYPTSVFTLKNTEEENMEGEGNEEEDDFKTDEDEGMEVDKQEVQKRKKVQGGDLQKKFKNNQSKSGRKTNGKVRNAK